MKHRIREKSKPTARVWTALLSLPPVRQLQPTDHRADSVSTWQEVVVVVALPSLLSFKKLCFSFAPATATSLLFGFCDVVKACFSLALADSLRVTIKITAVKMCSHHCGQTDSEQVVFSPVVWRRVNDQEPGGEKSKKRAPRGHHGNNTDTADCFHYSTQSWGHHDLTDVNLQNSIWILLTRNHCIVLYIRL